MKRRMLNMQEILRNEMMLQHLEACRDSGASFTVAAVSSNYVLWKNEKFYPKILIEYNTLTRRNWDNFDAAKVDEYNQRIYDVCEFMVEVERHKEHKKANNYLAAINARYDAAENVINEEFQRYMICSYLALIEMGYGNKRMNRINDMIVETFNACLNKEKRMSELRKELEDYGVIIELNLTKELNFPDAVAAGEYKCDNNITFSPKKMKGMAMTAEKRRRA